ncbi:hypothetical protein AAEY27_07255 [Kosakonia sp. BYX6]|uniref:Uncharacterized protein n=1 Tax=Kosakonia calanthes TaxID=3139408 RepID=A0ABZ3B8P1_9ENTR
MSTRTFVVLFFSAMALWVIWLLFATGLSYRVYLHDGAPDKLVMLAVAALGGLMAARYKVLRRIRTRFLVFCGVFFYLIATLWNAPEVWVRMRASEIVHSEAAFTIGHPGPPYARYKHCEAGLRFYDEFLKRSIELCTRDALVPPGARSVQLEKRVSSRGAIFTHYRFMSATGYPQGWWPVVRPSR